MSSYLGQFNTFIQYWYYRIFPPMDYLAILSENLLDVERYVQLALLFAVIQVIRMSIYDHARPFIILKNEDGTHKVPLGRQVMRFGDEDHPNFLYKIHRLLKPEIPETDMWFRRDYPKDYKYLFLIKRKFMGSPEKFLFSGTIDPADGYIYLIGSLRPQKHDARRRYFIIDPPPEKPLIENYLLADETYTRQNNEDLKITGELVSIAISTDPEQKKAEQSKGTVLNPHARMARIVAEIVEKLPNTITKEQYDLLEVIADKTGIDVEYMMKGRVIGD